MALAKFRNKDMFPSIFREFFDRDFFDTANMGFNDSTMPAVNIKETKDDFLVEVAAPGLKKEDFKIELDNNLLIISSEKEDRKEESKEGEYTRQEFSYQSFKRTFTLPSTIEEKDIKAKYKDGILNITLPKKEEAKEKPKKMISIG
ncbi:MAG TPA: Hsp20/alpha crystallin family protein [Bacteroidales bacterium]|nr:Hsp20/alpha crystallin family protein [Bacteroidales bacterium]HPR58889.1 Hsp20/alpha crystallin family protein [Bacteroidales bacterium]